MVRQQKKFKFKSYIEKWFSTDISQHMDKDTNINQYLEGNQVY